MAVYELKNEQISIGIDSLGAELKSLKKMEDGKEYMWCADARYWNRTSPVLFPFVGSVKNKVYRTKGKTWSMTQHGFARDMEFQLISLEADEIWFELDSNEETLRNYPYEFVLKLGYRISGNKVIVLWKVENPGTEEMFFSIGGHPAFNCPIRDGENREECFVEFGAVDQVVSTGVSENGLALEDEKKTYPLTEGKLALTEELFRQDALVIENRQTDTVALCGRDGKRYVKVTMDAPLFGVWSPSDKLAPFICIEPWYGRCDSEDFQGTLEERKWGNRIEPGQTWEAFYTIEVE